jgi:hypothetical protein
MRTEPKSTQFPVTNILARVRVVGCATNVLSLFIDQLASVEVGKSESISEPSLVRITNRRLTVRLNPFGMLDP